MGFSLFSAAAGGHGTHVVGSMLGAMSGASPDSDVAKYSGMAPAAKLVFFDLMAGTGGDGLDVPDALEEDYFKWAYGHGELAGLVARCGPSFRGRGAVISGQSAR